ncbi:MAG: Uma2 family endonuclease, partial [Candidatus Poribacteria bacterium]
METALVELNSLEDIAKSKKKISYEEFLELCDEDIRAEWVNGEVFIMTEPVTITHQKAVMFIMGMLYNYVGFHNLGEILFIPFLMKLENSARTPDIIYIHSNHLQNLKEFYLDGPADVAIEIMLKESVIRDRGDKFIEYESGGVTEYWLIDPIRKQAEFYRLGDDKCYHTVMLDAEDKYHSEA